jgi:hypothetical protein
MRVKDESSATIGVDFRVCKLEVRWRSLGSNTMS